MSKISTRVGFLLFTFMFYSCNEQPFNQKSETTNQTLTTESTTNTLTNTNTEIDTGFITETNTETDSSTNSISDTQTDTDLNLYEDQNISYEEALDRISNEWLINPSFMQIDETFQDWQILDLTAYTMHIFDLSQQGTLLGYEIDPTNEIDILQNLITTNITGFTDTQFQDLIDIQDLCTIVPEYSATPFDTSIYQWFNNVNSMQRYFILQFNVELSICQYSFTDETIEREQYAFGDLNFDIRFENIINSDQTEIVQNLYAQSHGRWLVLSDSMGYQDSLGYWFIENYNARVSYTNTSVESKVETTEFSAHFILRDGFINFDHRYFITQPDDQIILNHLGAKNPHAGKVEISTYSGKILIIEFSEDSVDIYIDDELRLENVSWADIRSRKLDMTFDYANDL